MPERESRKLPIPLKAATILTGAVLMVGGVGVARDGWINQSKAQDQVEQTLPHPDYSLVSAAKTGHAFFESQNTPAFTEVQSAAQRVIDQDKAFSKALDDNALQQQSFRELDGGMGAFIAGYLLDIGALLHTLSKQRKEKNKRLASLETQEAAN